MGGAAPLCIARGGGREVGHTHLVELPYSQSFIPFINQSVPYTQSFLPFINQSDLMNIYLVNCITEKIKLTD